MATKYVKFLKGTPKAYANLARKDPDTLYFITEADDIDGVLYLGSKLIGGTGNLATSSIDELRDVLIKNDLADNSFLIYDAIQKQWINKSFDELFPIFKGATNTLPGIPGLVPAPEVGDTNKFLRSDGTWVTIKTNGTAGLIQDVSSEFVIDQQGILHLNSLPQNISLSNTKDFTELNNSVSSLNEILNGTENTAGLKSEVFTLTTTVSNLNNIFINQEIYKAEVGDLSKLNRMSADPNSSLVDEINLLNKKFSWQEL